MKRRSFVLLAVILGLFLLCGCGAFSTDISSSGESSSDVVSAGQSSRELIKYENDIYTITLPASGKVFEVKTSYEAYLPYVTDELIISAEAKIADVMAQYPGNAGYFLGAYDGYLYLSTEVIRKIDPPDAMVVDGETITSGCNVDHEHLFFDERISMEMTGEEAPGAEGDK